MTSSPSTLPVNAPSSLSRAGSAKAGLPRKPLPDEALTPPESLVGQAAGQEAAVQLAVADLPVAAVESAVSGSGAAGAGGGLAAGGATGGGLSLAGLSSVQLLGLSFVPVWGAGVSHVADDGTPSEPFVALDARTTALADSGPVSGSLAVAGTHRDAVTYRLVGEADPEVAIAGNGTFTVAPRAADLALDDGETRTVTFQYIANDGLRDSTAATVTVTVTGRNDAPVAEDAMLSGMADGGAVGGQVAAVDADAEPLTYALVGEPPAGVVFNADGTFSVTPQAEDLNLSGGGSRVVTFQYVANDGTVDSAAATVSVTIQGVNHAPQAADDIFSTDYLTPLYRSLLDNDSDPDGDNLTVTQWSWNGSGTASVDAGGWLSYSPDGAAGYVEVMYTVSDGHGGESSAVARISVDGPVDGGGGGGGGGGNNNPSASDDGTFFLDSQSSLSLFPLQNDGDPDGDPLTLVNAYLSYGGGSVTVLGDGSVYYSADGYSGDAGIYYTVDDGRGGQSSAMMTLSVSPVSGGGDGGGGGGGDYGGGGGGEPVNQTPSAQDDILSTGYLNDISWNVIWNDSDPDGDPLSIINWSWNGIGSAFLEVNGQLNYSPLGSAGSAQITYTVDDGRGGQATANVWISVDGPVDGNSDLFIQTGDSPDDGVLLSDFFSGDPAAPLPSAGPALYADNGTDELQRLNNLPAFEEVVAA